jgi:DNA-binding LacI/PurR family transcriptional regulator
VVGIYAYIELFGHDSKYEYYRLLMKYLTRHSEANGRVYRTYLGSERTGTSSMADEDLLRHLSGGTLCGAILVNPPHNVSDIIQRGRESRVPVVAMVGGCNPDYSVWVDYAGSIRAMAEHLVKQGRRRVGIVFSRVSLTLRDPEQIARILTEAGCPPQPAWVVGREDTEAGGYDAARAMPFDEIDGLIVTDDMMTLGVDQRLSELNIDMPGKVTACTFWNHGSRLHLKKPFELFELDVERFAHGGLELVQNIIKGQRVSEPHVKFVLSHQPWHSSAREHGGAAVAHHRPALVGGKSRSV